MARVERAAALRPLRLDALVARRSTSPASLRYAGEEQDRAVSLLTRETGEGDRGCEADVVEGAQSRQLRQIPIALVAVRDDDREGLVALDEH